MKKTGDTCQQFTPLNLTSETLPSFNAIIDVNGLKSNPTFYQSAVEESEKHGAEIKIAPSENADGRFNSPMQTDDAILVTMGVLRGNVNTARSDPQNKTLYQSGTDGAKSINIFGDELGKFESAAEFRKSVQDYYKKELQGKNVRPGKNRFSAKGIRKAVFTSANIEKLAFLPYLRQIIETGKYVRTERRYDEVSLFDKHRHIQKFSA